MRATVCACVRVCVCVGGGGAHERLIVTAPLFSPHSSYLWSVSLPGKNGTTNFDLSKDQGAQVANPANYTSVQLAHERVSQSLCNST